MLVVNTDIYIDAASLWFRFFKFADLLICCFATKTLIFWDCRLPMQHRSAVLQDDQHRSATVTAPLASVKVLQKLHVAYVCCGEKNLTKND